MERDKIRGIKGLNHRSIRLALFSNNLSLPPYILATLLSTQLSPFRRSTILSRQLNSPPSPSFFAQSLLLRCAFCRAPISLELPDSHRPHLNFELTDHLLEKFVSLHFKQCQGLSGDQLISQEEDVLMENQMSPTSRPRINSLSGIYTGLFPIIHPDDPCLLFYYSLITNPQLVLLYHVSLQIYLLDT